jgi:hypothetical protein
MRRTWFVPTLCAIVAAAAPVLAVSEPTQEELQVNRRLLERWRADPEHYARLKRDYKAFQALPTEKRERLKELDRDLHEEDADSQARLRRVLNRYVEWLDGLSEIDRTRVDAAEDGNQRLRVVKEIREQEWIAHLARVDQERIRSSNGDQRAKYVDDLRKEERKRKKDWQLAFVNLEEPISRTAKPEHIQDFPAETRLYYHFSLQPMVGWGEDRDRVRRADGKWPDQALALWEMFQKYGVAKVPPGQWEGPRNFEALKPDELPKEMKSFFAFHNRPKESGLNRSDLAHLRHLNAANTKWPDFALAVHDVAEAKGVTLSKPLGPCVLKDFHLAVQKFYEQKLGPELSKKENKADLLKLENAQGKWPAYPLVFMEVAKKYNLKVPGTHLGGPPELWKAARGEP